MHIRSNSEMLNLQCLWICDTMCCVSIAICDCYDYNKCIVHFAVYLSSILFNNQNFRKRKCDSRDDKFCVLFLYNVYRPNIGLVFWCLCCIVVLIESAE